VCESCGDDEEKKRKKKRRIEKKGRGKEKEKEKERGRTADRGIEYQLPTTPGTNVHTSTG
jgi:hypothetical protein